MPQTKERTTCGKLIINHTILMEIPIFSGWPTARTTVCSLCVECCDLVGGNL